MSDTTKRVLLTIAIAAVTAAATKALEEISKLSVEDLMARKEKEALTE